MVAISADAIEQAWREYLADRSDAAARNQLVLAYRWIVRAHAERMQRTLPASIDIDDLETAGLGGLMRSLQGYDPARGVKFTSYCQRRIRGAMLDWLREMDDVSRSVRDAGRRMETAAGELRQGLGREPYTAEIAQLLGLTAAEYAALQWQGTAPEVFSLSQPLRAQSGLERPLEGDDLVADPRAEAPDVIAARRDALRAALAVLSRAERLIVLLYYYEGLSMVEIGLVLGLSESRISQVHAEVLARLRREIDPDLLREDD